MLFWQLCCIFFTFYLFLSALCLGVSLHAEDIGGLRASCDGDDNEGNEAGDEVDSESENGRDGDDNCLRQLMKRTEDSGKGGTGLEVNC